MTINLKTRLVLSFSILGLVSIVSITILVNFFLERQFIQYTIRNQEQDNLEIVDRIGQQYLGNNLWKIDIIEDIGVRALEEGKIVALIDSRGTPVWDARKHNSGLCQEMIQRMTKKMAERYPSAEGGFIKKFYPLLLEGERAGNIQIEHYGPFYFSDTELFFIERLNRILLILASAIIIASIILGVAVAGRISRPIADINAAASEIGRGHYKGSALRDSGITEVKELRSTIMTLADSLESKEKLRKQLTSDVAHELRTPLATLQSHLEAMIDGVWEPSVERLSGCHEEMIRIAGLVNDMETLARYEAEGISLRKEEFNLKDTAEKVLSLFQDQFREKGISLKIQGDNTILTGDSDKLKQVLMNLVTNSFKHTQQGGVVKIGIEKNESSVRLTVMDNGSGIPEEDLPFIFERFYRADRSRTRLTGGSGIGLTIVKEIVEAHGGNIEVRSVPGKETVFTVTLSV